MAAMSDARNVLFITADQWRGDCLSSEKHPLVRTPHLDALASQGVRFRRHFAQAAPCGPSRASLHTGMYLQNHRSGTNGTPLDARHTNWALEARRLGYDPVLFGYTDTSQDPRTLAPDDERLRSYEGLLPGIRPVVEMTTYPHAWAEWLRERGYAIPDDVIELYTRKADQPEWDTRALCGRPSGVALATDGRGEFIRRALSAARVSCAVNPPGSPSLPMAAANSSAAA